MKNYKNSHSAQMARQIARNREQNLPRLEQLKEIVGCMACGRCDVPARHIHGHHVDPEKKYKKLTHLANRAWPRLMREVFGLDRDKAGGGGPIEFVCDRYHQERHLFGAQAKPCCQLEAEGIREPWKIRKQPRNKKGAPNG